MSFRSRSRRALRQPARKRLRYEPLEDRRLLAAYTVTSAANDGAGSLRAAIAAVNLGSYDAIDFNASYTINLTAELEAITQNNITIDGETNTIIINSSGAGSTANGLTIKASGVTIKNLTIQNFGGAGVRIDGTTSVDADNNIVRDNIITGNGVGVVVVGNSAIKDSLYFEPQLFDAPTQLDYDVFSRATGNQILDNDILNNAAQGVYILHASANTVSGNTLGNNGAAGVEIEGTGTTIVETFPGDDLNRLPPREKYTVENSATGNVIVGNWIGIGQANEDLTNTGDGVLIDRASYNTIGGIGEGEGNVISYNGENGVRVTGAADYQPPTSLFSSSSSFYGGSFAERRQTLTAIMSAVAANLVTLRGGFARCQGAVS
jgi:parallel beta-helix repeat protein